MEKIDNKLSHKKEEKIDKKIESDLKKKIQVIYKPDILQYLNEKQGKIPVYSGMHGKVQLELWISGYLGIKYLF